MSQVYLHIQIIPYKIKGGDIIKVINTIETFPDHSVGEIYKNKKTYYVCSVCGRLSFRKIRAYGKTYCYKHYNQQKKYGHAIDDNPRTVLDRNEIRIVGEIAYVDLYDKKCNVIATAIIDAEDVPKVRYTKWKLSGSGYAMNTPKFKGKAKHMSRVILNTEEFVDHINHNTLDNRKCNLRTVTKSQNQMNSNYKGVTSCGNGKFCAYIKLNQKLINLGEYIFEEEALFARWYAETILFKDYRYPKEKPRILPDRERQIQEYVDKKVQRL